LRDLDLSDLDWIDGQERSIFGVAAWSRSAIEEGLSSGRARYRGVEVDHVLVAYAVFGWEGDEPHLMNLAVVPTARRQGHARALLDDFFAGARRAAARRVWLEVAATNAPAIALYREYGFEVIRVRQRYYQPEDVDALVMCASATAKSGEKGS
jgi:ribosomal-protein-alanine acetyltransferase